MKINKAHILWTIVIAELFIILFSPLYLRYKYPTVFQKHRPSVLVIDIFGEVYSLNYPFNDEFTKRNWNTLSATEIVEILKKYENDSDVKAFILNLDSNGGDGWGQGELVTQIKSMKKPFVAVVRDEALSSGYFVAASTQRVFANELSNIGDIGLTTVVEYIPPGSRQWRKCFISSSAFKIMYQEDCPGFDIVQYQNEKASLKKGTQYMASEIAEFRELPVPYVVQLSDGTIFKGNEALKLKLVDEIGGIDEAVDWLEKELGMKLEIIYFREMQDKH